MVDSASDATSLDEVKAANTVDAPTQAKARWVQTPSLSLAVVVSSLLGSCPQTRPSACVAGVLPLTPNW